MLAKDKHPTPRLSTGAPRGDARLRAQRRRSHNRRMREGSVRTGLRRFLRRMAGPLCGVIGVMAAGAAAAAPAEIKIGILNTSASGPLYVASEKGYFAAEDLVPKLVVFDAAQPIAVASASGDV